MNVRSTLRAVVPAVALTAVAGLVLAACGGGTTSTPGDSTAPVVSPTGQPAPVKPSTWPLTGLPAPGDASYTKHPVYIAKVDNTYASDPQYGFGSADMVTEELVEGGITRLAAFFYTKLPEKAGPIRSMRLTDIGLAKPIDARLVTSGAAPVTIQGLQKAGVNYIAMGNPDVKRVVDGSHDYLHSVVANLDALGKEALISKPTRPHDFFQFGKLKGGKPATKIDARFSSARTDEFAYAGGKYTLTNSYFEKGDVFTPDTVVVCYVHTSLAPYRDPAGNPVPVTQLQGSEKALIFHGGKVVTGTWHKAGPAAYFHFADSHGKTIKIPAGHTWLELIPLGGPSVGVGSVTWTK